MKPVKPEPMKPMKPVKGAPGPPLSPVVARRRRAVQMFLDQGFPRDRAVRLGAMYLAALAKLSKLSEAEKQRRSGAIAPLAPIWTPPKGLPPHERVAARLVEFGRLSSEQAHQKAAARMRAVDNGDPA